MKRVPEFKTDAEAELFLEQDLSGLDFKQFKPMHFEVARKEAALNVRLPAALMDAVRAKAKAKGIPYARYVRMVLEADLQRSRLKPTREKS
ncbi:MAG: CopG family antitoxin [Acidithiobacillus sp.]|nr:CopG family antitoxin [Acidithiobacillus sp.]MDA8154784.1 CopG family antitoxin [Acidithiobacillus sp.]